MLIGRQVSVEVQVVTDSVIPKGAIFDEMPLNFCNKLLREPWP